MQHCTVMADAYGHPCLPHTGLPLWWIVLAGIVLLSIGGAIAYHLTDPRRPRRRRPNGWPPVRHK